MIRSHQNAIKKKKNYWDSYTCKQKYCVEGDCTASFILYSVLALSFQEQC